MTEPPEGRLMVRPLRRVIVIVALALVAAGCSGAQPQAAAIRESTTEAQVDTTTSAPTTTTPPPTYPLTGRPAADAGIARRPAVTVKIDNAAAARPQAGIDAADVVYEEFTEGITRFIVVFHSGDAEVVGPVRSVRPADPVVVRPFGGVLGFSGGSPAAVALATDTPLATVTENDRAVMYRRSGRAAPHNLYTSTALLLSRAPEGATPPAPLAEFLPPGQAFSGPGSVPVASLSIVPAPYTTAGYDWDAGSATWLRTTDGRPHLLESGNRIAPTTVVVQFTPYLGFVADSKVEYPEVIGTGEVWILANGQMVKGTWAKASAEAPTTFTDTAGAPIRLAAGQTWFHLVAPGSAITTG